MGQDTANIPCTPSTTIRIFSIIPAFRRGDENPHRNRRDDQCPAQGLHENRVLHLPQRRFLDPDLPVKDLTDHVALVVSSHPRLVLVAVAAAHAVERFLQFHVPPFVIVVGKQFPRPEMTVMHAVKNLTKKKHSGSADTFSLFANHHRRDGITSLTTHIPFHAAISVDTPIKSPTADKTRHPRPALLKTSRMPVMIPATIPPIPNPRAKITRGRLPLQMLQRMKFGWA